MKSLLKFNGSISTLKVKDRGIFEGIKIDAVLSSDGINYISLSENSYHYIPLLKAIVSGGKAVAGVTPAKIMKIDQKQGTIGLRIKSKHEFGFARQIKVPFFSLLEECMRIWNT